MSKVATDNTALQLKINLRVENLPDKKELKVLDAFAGFGTIWDGVVARTSFPIARTSIDMRNIPGRVYLRGDNVKYLRVMDLRKFDVIDLDAYGSPFPQIEAIRINKNVGSLRVFFTFIRIMQGGVHKKMLAQLGYTPDMVGKIPTLFNRCGFVHFLNYLSMLGIAKVTYYKLLKGEYYYGFFDFFRRKT